MPIRELKDYQYIAGEMIKADENLLKKQLGMDRMVHLDYDLPNQMKKLEWVRRFISSNPFEAIRAATRALATLMPRITIDPISVLKAFGKDEIDPDSDQAKTKANEWEKALLWQFSMAMKRLGTLLPDIIRSALVYDEIVGEIIYLPEQIKAVKEMGGSDNRYKMAFRMGDFAIIIRNPKEVHIQYSPYGMERVLIAVMMTPQEVVDFWGTKVDEIKQAIYDKKAPKSYIQYRYADLDAQCIWLVQGDDYTRTAGDTGEGKPTGVTVLVQPSANPHPFLPVIARHGGTNLDAEPENQRIPLLDPVYRADQWINTNIVSSLLISQSISEFGKPKYAVSGPQADETVIDMGEAGGRIDLKPNNTVTTLQQTGLDPATREMRDQLDANMNASTVSRVLVSADASPNDTFSGYNLRVTQAIASLNPWRLLSEQWLADCFMVQLYYIHYCKGELKGYGRDRRNKGFKYEIKWDEIDPECLYLDVTLQPDTPIDRQQKVNTAVAMSRDLKVSVFKILEELGDPDPEGTVEEYYKEQFAWAAVQGKLKLIAAQASGEIDQLANQKAQEIVKQQMQAMQDAQKQQSQAAGPGPSQQQGGAPSGLQGLPPELAGALGGGAPNLSGGQGMPNVSGDGFNVGMGGQVPAQANPAGNVREQQTGQAANGMPLQ